MQLFFSFATRILLSIAYDFYYTDPNYAGIGEWQLNILLTAYKILSRQNGENLHGIFPFQIIKIYPDGRHRWNGAIHEGPSNYNYIGVIKLKWNCSMNRFGIMPERYALKINAKLSSNLLAL
ncbi:hypothetical protein niasHS_008511 [Heterodera schachtii]|uniref:Uncharacterized protein n=1 Tax=Heterodera schachtii TaxID=97005 RepID=A0ABD2JEX4_HETSC